MPATRRKLVILAALARSSAGQVDARFFGVGYGSASHSIAGRNNLSAHHHHRRFTGSSSRTIRPRDDAAIDIVISKPRGGGGGDGIEENPDYAADEGCKHDGEGDESTSDGEGSDDDCDDKVRDSNEGEDDDRVTAALLSKTRLYAHSKSILASKSARSLNKRVSKIVRDNRVGLLALLVIVAFRKDIYVLARAFLLVQMSGSSLTNVLKLIVVGVVVHRYFLPHDRRAEAPIDSDNDSSATNQTQTVERQPSKKRQTLHAIVPLLLGIVAVYFLPSNVLYIVAPIILKMLSGGGPDSDGPLGSLLQPFLGDGSGGDAAAKMAYLPRLEQHYAFEQLNERYYRDWGAYRKAFPANPMVAKEAAIASSSDASASSASVTTGSSAGTLSSLLSSLAGNSKRPQASTPSASSNNEIMVPSTKYPSEYNNGTVIVMDMTTLDSKASRMETIRDQISFLIHLVTFEDADRCHSLRKSEEGRSVNATTIVNATNITALNDESQSTTSSSSSSSPRVEVIVLLESPGGGVSQYGLAASHLARLRETPNVKLTICIDSVAASGGYMMACMSSPGQLFCAPFATVGSIGVIGQSINLQKTLEGYGARPYVFRSGTMKNPVGIVGDVTREGLGAMQDMVDRVHGSFRDHVAGARGDALARALAEDAAPRNTASEGNYFHLGGGQTSSKETSPSREESIERVMDRVATGDVFMGTRALELGLVDRLVTSDEYIAERIMQGSRVLKLVDHRTTRGLFGITSHRGGGSVAQGPSFGTTGGTMMAAVGLLKRTACRMASELLAWADNDGLVMSDNGSSVPNFSARSAMNDF